MIPMCNLHAFYKNLNARIEIIAFTNIGRSIFCSEYFTVFITFCGKTNKLEKICYFQESLYGQSFGPGVNFMNIFVKLSCTEVISAAFL